MLMGGGDQLYYDGVIRELELQDLARMTKQEKKRRYQLTGQILFATVLFRSVSEGELLDVSLFYYLRGVVADFVCHRPMLSMCGKRSLSFPFHRFF